jgi:putative MATE family efflux protein
MKEFKYIEKNKISKNILQEKTINSLLRLSMPIFIGMISHIIYHNVDLYFVGKISSDCIASIGFVYPISFLFYGFLNGIGSALTSIVGNRFGAMKFKEIDNISKIGTSFLVFLGIIYFFIIYFFGKNILVFIGVPSNILNQTYSYLFILSISSIFDAYNIAVRSIYTGKGNSKTPMLIISIGAIINIFLDPFFIHYFSFSGAAIATTISNLLVFISFIYLVKKKNFVNVKIVNFFKKEILVLLKIGIPASITMIIISFGNIIYNYILTNFSIDAIASIQINTRIEDVFFLFVISISYGAMTLISMFIGAKDFKKLSLIIYQSISINVLIGLILSFTFYNFSSFLINIFTDNHNVISISETYFKHISFIYPLIAFGLSTGRILQGFGTSIPMLLITSVRVLLLGVPLAYIFTYILEKEIQFVWFAMIISSIVAFCIAFVWLFKKLKNISIKSLK